jgi:hypothetical protein
MSSSTQGLWDKSLKNVVAQGNFFDSAASLTNSKISANSNLYTKTLWDLKQWPKGGCLMEKKDQIFCKTVPLKGQCHEIIFTQIFSSIISILSYKRYSMRILNFDEFLLCSSAKKETRRCRLHRWVWTPHVAYARESGLTGVGYTGKFVLPGVAYSSEYRSSVWPTQGAPQQFFSKIKLTGVGYTGESGLTGLGYTGESGQTSVGYTGESRLPCEAYTGESLVQPSRPANALKGRIP